METVPLAEAARRLGLSVEGVRKRLKRGTIGGQKVDGVWFVNLPEPPTEPDNALQTLTEPDIPPTIVQSLQADNATLRARLEDEQRRFDQLLQAFVQQRPILPPPKPRKRWRFWRRE